MKFKGSKKIVSLFLAVLMVVSSVPAFALSASAAVNSTDVSALETAMSNYETKMKTGGIMTNMKAAYDAYVNAQKAIDAVKYGYSTSIDVSAVATNLTNATNNMNTWTSYKGTMKSKMPNDANYLDDKYMANTYKNLLYADETATNSASTDVETWSKWGGRYLWSCGYLTYSNVVMLYDGGTAPQTGVMFTCEPKAQGLGINKKAMDYATWITGNNGGVKLALERWKGWSDNGDYQWIMNKPCADTIYASDNYSYNTSVHENTVQYGNYLTFDATNDSFTEGTYVKTYTPTWSFYSSNENKDNRKKGDITASMKIQIFNYEAVLKAIDSTKLTIANVANYKQGGLSTLFSDIESLMKDPNSFFTDSNGARTNGINSCSSYYSGVITNTKNDLKSVTADNKNYDDLRTAITDADTVSTAKTADSLVTYGKAISAARNVFANDVATRGYDSPENAQAKAKALNDAKSALVNVDTDDAYSNFEAAVTVVNAMDKDAFKNQDEVTNQINSAKAKVYTTLTDSADIEAYTLAIGTAPSGELKNSTSVDTVTKELLNFASNPDESLINHYTVSVGATVFNKGTETNLEAVDLGSKKYGEIVDINVNDLFSDVNNIADKTISWTVQYKNSNNETISNQKVRNDEPTISVKATANIVVTALVTDETKTEETTGYTVKFLDIYGKLADVAYTTDKPESGSFDMDSYTVGDKIYTPEIPFYTLKGFTVSSPDSNNVVTVRPTYTTEIRLGVTVYNGTAESSSLKSDSTVQKTKTVTVSTTVAHIGWAVVKDNKYQIVAYTDGDYQFVALGDDNSSLIYTPIIEQDGGYAVYNSDATTTALTASNVYQFENNSAVSKDKVSDDAYLNAKIAAKAPFTYVEEYTTLDVSGTTMYRYYVRITAGSDAQLIGFGVEADSKKYSLTSKNDLTGQYSASFRSAKSEFKAYVSYSFTYSYGGTDYNISTADYATL